MYYIYHDPIFLTPYQRFIFERIQYDLNLGPLKLADDLIVRDIMASAWTNFAIYGDPTPPGSSDLSWTPVDPASGLQQYWNISGTKATMASSQEIQNRMNLWDEIMTK